MANNSSLLVSARIWTRGVIGIVIGVFFFWLALRQTSWQQVQTILTQANISWLILAMSFYFLDIFVRILRWRGLLWEIKKLSLNSVGIALIVGYAMNNILPARLGELFRANFAGRRYRVSRSAIAGSIVVERVLDGLVVVLSLVLGRLFLPEQAIVKSLTTIGILLFSSIFLVLWFSVERSRKINKWLARFPPVIATRINSFRQGLGGIRGAKLIVAIRLSLVIWLLEGIALWAVLQSVNVSLNWQQMLSVVGIVSLSTLLPSAPGFVGTYQYAYALVVSLFGYDSAQGVAAATATQIFLLGSLTLIGLGLYSSVNLVNERS